jgi:hypothetical protein
LRNEEALIATAIAREQMVLRYNENREVETFSPGDRVTVKVP